MDSTRGVPEMRQRRQDRGCGGRRSRGRHLRCRSGRRGGSIEDARGEEEGEKVAKMLRTATVVRDWFVLKSCEEIPRGAGQGV